MYADLQMLSKFILETGPEGAIFTSERFYPTVG